MVYVPQYWDLGREKEEWRFDTSRTDNQGKFEINARYFINDVNKLESIELPIKIRHSTHANYDSLCGNLKFNFNGMQNEYDVETLEASIPPIFLNDL
jgi:hypothetical protein